MSSEDKLPLLKESFKLLWMSCRVKTAWLSLPMPGRQDFACRPHPAARKRRSRAPSTNWAQAVLLPARRASLTMKSAQENFITGGNNRVILNRWRLQRHTVQPGELVSLIEEKPWHFLTVLGVERVTSMTPCWNRSPTMAMEPEYIDNLEAKGVHLRIRQVLYRCQRRQGQVDLTPALCIPIA